MCAGAHWEGTTILLGAVTKVLAWYAGGSPSWSPFLGTGPGNRGTAGFPKGTFLDTRVYPIPTSLSVVALPALWYRTGPSPSRGYLSLTLAPLLGEGWWEEGRFLPPHPQNTDCCVQD